MAPHTITQMGIVHVPEGRRIFSGLTVKENLTMGAFNRKDKQGIKKDLEWIFSLFPILEERLNQPGGTLSGGEQQMLAISRGLMSNPKLMMLDEPSLGLAPLLVKEVFEVIEKINKEDGVTILLVEQNAASALSISDYAYVIETGEIMMKGDAKALLSNPDVQKAYLGM
jgi:branched-chain amino acid transport system ATP-binding protein